MITKILNNNCEYFVKYDASNVKIDNDICSNWWPISTNTSMEMNENMHNSSCRVCANWSPNIEEIEDIVKPITIIKNKYSCTNVWPKC